MCCLTWAQDKNSDTVYYDTVKRRNLAIKFSRWKTQENQLKHREISPKFDCFHSKSLTRPQFQDALSHK